MKKRTLIALILALCLLAAILSACGSKQEDIYYSDYDVSEEDFLSEPNDWEDVSDDSVGEAALALLHPEILAVADDPTVEYYVGSYLLCVGEGHNIVQMTRDWTLEESWFVQSGSLTPISTGDIFEDISVSYSVGGEYGVFTEASFSNSDLLPVLDAIGALDADGSMRTEQIQICAKSSFDAPILFVLTQDYDGLITFAALWYNELDGEYVWDGWLYETTEHCCFDQDGNFCYIDEYGVFQMISL